MSQNLWFFVSSEAVKYQKKIVLHCLDGCPPNLEQLVSEFRAAGVTYVGVVGRDCSRTEDIIDDICVGWGDDIYSLLTASHRDGTLAEAVEFAESLSLEFEGPVQVVEC